MPAKVLKDKKVSKTRFPPLIYRLSIYELYIGHLYMSTHFK